MPNSNWSNSSAPVSATAQITDLASLGGSWVPGTALSATTGVFSGLLTAGAGLAVTGAATFSSSVSMGALTATDITVNTIGTVARSISVLGSPNEGTYMGYLLLAKAYVSGLQAASLCQGTFTLDRGSVSSGNRLDVFTVNSHSAYNGQNFSVSGHQGGGYFNRLVTVTYAGTVYHAIETVSAGGGPDNGVRFTGSSYNCSPIYVDATYVSAVTAFTDTTPFYISGAVSMGALTATTGTFSGAVSMGALTATSWTAASGVLNVAGGQTQIFFKNSGTTVSQITSNFGDGNFYIYHNTYNAIVINSTGGATFVNSVSMGALTATTGDFSGWVQLGEYNAAGTYPSTGKYGFAFSRNFTNGGSELDIWNTNTIAPTGFVFRQMTGASTQVLAAVSMGALTATTGTFSGARVTGTWCCRRFR